MTNKTDLEILIEAFDKIGNVYQAKELSDSLAPVKHMITVGVIAHIELINHTIVSSYDFKFDEDGKYIP